jgi:hypothetical protein
MTQLEFNALSRAYRCVILLASRGRGVCAMASGPSPPIGNPTGAQMYLDLNRTALHRRAKLPRDKFALTVSVQFALRKPARGRV